MNYILGNQPETKEAEKKEKEIKIEKEEINSEHEKAIKIKKHFLFEDKSKREPNAKHYVGNDGTATAVYSAKAVHFLDGESSGLSEIDNSLSDDGEIYRTKANSFKTRFKKRSADGEIFEVADGKCKVGLKSRDLSKHCGCDADNCICEHSDCAESSLIFKDVTPNVDLQYSVDSDRVKENIIIKEKCDNYEYDFGMNIENLETCISDDGKTLQLKDTDSGKVKFYIPAPFMIDAAGAKSELVCYEIADKSAGALDLKVIADNDWINAEERKFPVTIDPQIVAGDSSIFSYEYFEAEEMHGSCGTYLNWIKTDLPGIISVHKMSKFILKVNFSSYTFSKRIVSSVKLNLQSLRSTSCYLNVGDNTKEWDGKEIDITDIFKRNIKECILTFTGKDENCTNIVIDNNYAPQLIIEYIANENEAETKTFSLAGGVTGFMDLETGAFTTSFSDIEAGSSALPLQIAHTHLKSDDDFNCGDDWRLNLHQKLIKSGDEYVYADGNGRKHMITEVYYYVDGSSRKTVNKSEVTINSNGLLSCNVNGVTYEVTRELRTNEGLRLVTRLNGIKRVQYFEQRQDEEKQLEEYVVSCEKTVNDLVVVELDGTFYKIANVSSADIINVFFNMCLNKLCLSESEALQYKNLIINRDSMQHKYDNFKITKPDSNEVDPVARDSKEHLKKQLENLEKQIILYKSSSQERLENAKKLYTEYISKFEQLKQLKRQLPTAYLIDESGKILCFNTFGDLCAITDRYENVISVEWNEIITSEGKKEVITAVYDGERKTAFKYNRAGKLISITAPDGNRVTYTYSGNALLKAKFSDGKINYFRYTSNNIARVRCNDHTISEIKYNGYIPKSITTNSTVTEVTDSTETVAESNLSYDVSTSENLLSSVQIIYEPNYVSIDDGKSTEYTLLDANKKTCGSYTVQNGKADGLTLYCIADRLYEFTVIPKKTADIKNASAGTASTIISYLGTPPVISTLPGMTADYTNYAEADWELVTLDDFNRPKSAETNWRRADTTTGKTVYTKQNVTYEYAAGEPDYNCLKKTIREYTNLNGTASTANAEKKVYVEKYSYCEHGNLVKTESYVEGEEGTNGITVTEKVCDDKGNIVKEYTYNTLDSTTKFYKESEVAEDGKVTAEIDETGENKTKLIYNEGTNTVKTQILPNGGKLSYGYDESGRITGITQSTESGEENSTSIKYTLGLPTRLTSGNNVVYYEYDYKRRPTKVTVNGTETGYAYDESNETTTVTYAGVDYKTYKDKDGNVTKTEAGGIKQVEYVYENGLLKTFEDKITGDSTSYSYAANKALLKVSNSKVEENYQYNDYGELAVKAITGEVSQEYGYTYRNNAARDIEYIALPNGLNSYPLKDLNGRNTGRELKSVSGNKVYGEYISYVKVGDHATNMPGTVWYANGNEIKENIRYKYDSCGNITEIRENGVLTVRYGYDAINRLVREDNRKFNKTWLIAYDNCGNITSKREFAFTLRTRELLEELESTEIAYTYEGDRITGYNGKINTYDDYGKPVIYKGETLEWESGKRLKKYGEKTYGYDGLGRRISKGATVFTYDNDGKLIEQSNGMEFEYDGNGISGIKYGEKNYIYRKNVQGDITHILDMNGNVIAEYAYDAWGNCKILKDTDGIGEINPFRYRSYYYDTETKLYYLQTRYYDPETGRFISQDDVSYLDPEHINGLNLYAYCGNNPVMNVDPSGHKWWHWLIGIAIVAATTLAMVATAGLAAAVLGVSAGVAASMCVGAGIATATAGIVNLVTQASMGIEEFDLGSLMFDMVVSGTVGMISGGISGALGGFSAGATAGVRLVVHTGVQVGANTILSLGAYVFQSIVQGEQITLYGAGIATIGGVLSGLFFNSSSTSSFILSLGLEIAGQGESIVGAIRNFIKSFKGKKI